MIKTFPVILILFSLASCSTTPKMSYSQASKKQYASKTKGCDFNFRSTMPKESFEEIGTINLAPSMYGNGIPLLPSDPDEMKLLIQDRVCSVGGDAVVTDINGHGQFVRATIIKFQ